MNPEPDSAPSDLLEAQAANWLVAHDRGLTASEQVEFTRWLAADPRHEPLYAEMADAWTTMAKAPSPPLQVIPAPRRFRPWMLASTAAAAAAILLTGYFSWWQPRFASYAETARTEIGGRREISLPDGSTILLNTDSELTVDYSRSVRRVHLAKGEAHFTVAKNPSRPFLVFAGHLDVRAVGTAFSVRLHPESVDVLVTEGRVRLEPVTENSPTESSQPPLAFVGAGEKASVPRNLPSSSPSVPVIAVPPDAIVQALAWRDHQLQFSTETLADMVQEFNRYNSHQLVIDDPRLAAMRFGGTFPATDAASFVALLEKEFNVVAEKQAGRTLLRRAP